MSKLFEDLCKVYNISYDDFVLTIEKRHENTVIKILKYLEKKGDIYKGEYEGLYCVDCETFYTEKDLIDGKCPYHPNKKIELLKEETYFFKLSKYQKQLIKNIESDRLLIWPTKKKKEILNRLKEPLRDLSISRKNVSWGIPLPFDKQKTVAVWNDALVNYLTTVDYPNKKFENYWPAVHVIGVDIVWHHTVIWGAMLLALGLGLPKVIVHGFVNVGGEKLSKSKGLVINPLELAQKYSVDSVRYFLMRKIPFGDDGDFSEKALIEAHNGELANKLGNLVSRVSGLIEKNGISKCEVKLLKKLNEKKINKLIESFELDKALSLIFAFIDICNEEVQDKKPWETKNKEVLYELKEAILKISELLWPFIPESSEKIKKQFSVKKIKKSEPLFKKI
jgi:methionyl-tRNA synthetase